MSAPTVSVVIPVFNRAAIMGATLKSVLAQTFSDFEVIVIDDGSRDDIAAALKPFTTDVRVHLVRLPINRGVSAARNAGVRAARGRYVAFLDSDDLWEPEKLARQVKALSRCAKPDLALCGTGSTLVLGENAVSVRLGLPWPAGRSFGDYLFIDRGFIHASAIVLPRALALETPFREDLRLYEDIAFFLELGAKGVELIVLEQPLMRRHLQPRQESLSDEDSRAHRQRFFALVSPILSEQAKLAFEARFLAPYMWTERPTLALNILVTALKSKVISIRAFFLLLSQCLLGVRRHVAIRAQILRTIARWRRNKAATA